MCIVTGLPPQLWAEDNGSAIEELTQKVFLGKWEDVSIINAVKTKLKITDDLEVNENELRPIPKDLLLLKSWDKMTQEEKGTRFTYWHALDYRPAHVKEKEVLPTPNWDQNQFGKHLDDFKELIYQLAVPFINSHFATEFNKEFSHVKVNGRTIRSINDLVEFIHTYDPTCKKSGNPPLKQVRKMVYFAMYGNWGKSHYWAEAGELKTLAMLGMTYNGNKMASGKVQIRKQRGGGIKAHFVKKLDMERNKINDAWARVRLERFFKRDVYKPPTPKETEQDQQRSKNPRADKSHLRKYLVFCKIAQGDAFDGAYLLLEGHPERAKIDRKESGTVSMASTSEESQSENSSEASLISEVAAGLQGKEAEDFSTILKALQETKGQGGALQALSALLKGRKRERLEEQTATQAGPPPASKKPRVAAPGTPAPSVVTMKSNTSTVSDVTAEDPEAASNLLKLPVGELDHLENFNGDTEIMEEAAGGKFFDDIDLTKGTGLTPKKNEGESTEAPKRPRPQQRGKQLKMQPRVASAKAPRGKPKTKQTTVKDQEKTRSSPVKRWKVPTTFIEGGKELDMICENNVHGNPQKWTVYDSGFFVPSYQKTKKAGFVVSHCLKCCRKFIAGKGVKVSDPETEFLVTRDTEGTVWACPGAVKRSKGCNCVRALCAPCYTRVKDVCE